LQKQGIAHLDNPENEQEESGRREGELDSCISAPVFAKDPETAD
jgi:hypothetical protein